MNKTKLLIILILLLCTVTTATFALLSKSVGGRIIATGAKAVLELETSEADGPYLINSITNSKDYIFTVKNFKTVNGETERTEIEYTYYIKINGISELSNGLSYKLYRINQDNSETELYKLSSGQFSGYFKATDRFGIGQNESQEYRLVITASNIVRTEGLDVSIDLGYKQYISEEEETANAPELATGMIPVVWDETNLVWKKIASNDTDWYDYENKKWANAVTVSNSGAMARSEYISAPSGTVIPEADITSMWVWIPRFVYKINQRYYHTAVTTANVEAGTQMVDIRFSKSQEDGGDFWSNRIVVNEGTVASSSLEWTTHPAFTFGDNEINGFWMAKFEASNDSSISSSSVTNIYIRPCRQSIYKVNMNNTFNGCRNMEINAIYGWELSSSLNANGTFATDTNGIDTHLCKNSEWTAVGFLAHSKCGVGIDSLKMSPNVATGGSTTYTEVFTTNVNQSTTGNAYGVYDMAGYMWECVAGYIGEGTYLSAANLLNADNRYVDRYSIAGTTYTSQASVYNMMENFKAGIWETSTSGVASYTSWFGGRSNIGYRNGNSDRTIITRGGTYSGSGQAKVHGIFAYGYGNGADVVDSRSFRPVLVKE